MPAHPNIVESSAGLRNLLTQTRTIAVLGYLADVTVTVTPERHPMPISNWSRAAGYYATGLGTSNQQKDKLIFDYSEIIALYNTAYAAAGGSDNASNAHFAATPATGAGPVPADVRSAR